MTKILSQTPIREALMDRLHTGGHDLVVLGSRGRGALTASFLGSVSHYALNHSEVPVLIVHAEEESKTPEATARTAAPHVETDLAVCRPVSSPGL